METEKQDPWRWVIMASSVMAILLTTYGGYNIGVLKVAVLRHYGSDDIITTWMMTYHYSLFALAAPLASVVINMVNCRACVVLAGILCLVGYTISAFITNFSLLFVSLTLVGVGRSLGMIGSVMILAYYFPDRTNIVTGVSLAGAGLGMFIHPPLFAFLDEVYGLPGAFLLSGAVAFHGMLFERERAQESRVRHVLCPDWRDWLSILTDRAFLSFLLSVFSLSIAYDSQIILLPTYNIRLGGLSQIEASFASSMSGIGSVVSRVLGGVLAHDRRVGNLLVYCGLLGVEALAALVAPPLLTSGKAGAFTYCLLVGLYTGGAIALVNPVIVNVVGLQKSAIGLGVTFFWVGVGALIGAPIVELVTGESENPYLAFGFLAGAFGLSAIFGLLVAYLRPSAATDECANVLPSHPDKSTPENENTVGSSPFNLCHVTLGVTSTAYGMELCAVRGRQGQLVTTVDVGSPAAAAGLQNGDVIVEVNGDDVRTEDIHQVVRKVRACGDQVALLVLRCETDDSDRQTDDTAGQTDFTARQTDDTDRQTDDTDRQTDDTDRQTDNTDR
ncbi:hypothetical protein BaRGS_00036184 [Batillaria attramentaria]|uniref:Uncharacterized protein n=1 Tax=Batillaria attramentaria TaxID=370345 RepID=A0ABD0JDT0_9CAEN